MRAISPLYRALLRFLFGGVGQGLSLFAVRLALASVFWWSGRSKIEEGTLLSISDGTYFLFENEYMGVPLPPAISAVMATAAEHILPIMLVLGLATRLSALGLFMMTMVIQIFVYPEAFWSVHLLWFALALVLVTHGAGRFSLDNIIDRRTHK